ncbi:MAG: glycosyltransferase [Burkholderiaceae bacterium]|nr:glycosyltransferase [Burkholderiaceae bacterium]
MPARFELLHTPLDRPSGGNVYNRCLLDAAARNGFPLSSIVVDSDEIEARFRERTTAFRIWDGLLLERLACRCVLEPHRRGVLLHWLPSCDPAIGSDERARRESVEDAIVAAATLVVVPGEALQRRLRRRHPRQTIVRCEPGLREPFLAPKRSDGRGEAAAVELLTVSNLLPAKGLLDLLRALASLRSLAWRWHVVGDGRGDPDYARRFDEESRRLRLATRIVRHGPLDARGVAERMDLADVFVFPSRFESYGMVLAEAAARALPALACRVGDAEQLFRDGIDALLVTPGDEDALREALRRMIADASLRARLRSNLDARAPARCWDDALAEFATAARGATAPAPPSSRCGC